MKRSSHSVESAVLTLPAELTAGLGKVATEDTWFNWQPQPEINPADIQTIEVPAQSESVLRDEHRAVVMAALPQDIYNLEPRAGVAYLAVAAIDRQSGVQMSILPPEKSFGAVDHGNTSLIGVAILQRRKAIEASLGLWLPEQQRLVTPDMLFRLESGIPARQLAQRYPEVPLI